MVMEAMEQGGLNRARIRDGLMGVRRYEGVAGTILMNNTANSISPPHLVRITGGRLVAR
jgi:hypothetical protein